MSTFISQKDHALTADHGALPRNRVNVDVETDFGVSERNFYCVESTVGSERSVSILYNDGATPESRIIRIGYLTEAGVRFVRRAVKGCGEELRILDEDGVFVREFDEALELAASMH